MAAMATAPAPAPVVVTVDSVVALEEEEAAKAEAKAKAEAEANVEEVELEEDDEADAPAEGSSSWRFAPLTSLRSYLFAPASGTPKVDPLLSPGGGNGARREADDADELEDEDDDAVVDKATVVAAVADAAATDDVVAADAAAVVAAALAESRAASAEEAAARGAVEAARRASRASMSEEEMTTIQIGSRLSSERNTCRVSLAAASDALGATESGLRSTRATSVALHRDENVKLATLGEQLDAYDGPLRTLQAFETQVNGLCAEAKQLLDAETHRRAATSDVSGRVAVEMREAESRLSRQSDTLASCQRKLEKLTEAAATEE